jgi:hypothetical protein
VAKLPWIGFLVLSNIKVVNELGQLLNVTLTPGNIDDRKPVPDLLCKLFGKIFGVSEAHRRYRGYVSEKLASQLLEEFGIQFFAKPRRNMKNRLMRLHDKLLSRKRSIIETITAFAAVMRYSSSN